MSYRIPHLDPNTQRELVDISAHWLTERKDGSPLDTSELAEQIRIIPIPGGSVLRLSGLHATASGYRVKCVITNATTEFLPDDGEKSPGKLIGSDDRFESDPVYIGINLPGNEDIDIGEDGVPPTVNGKSMLSVY